MLPSAVSYKAAFGIHKRYLLTLEECTHMNRRSFFASAAGGMVALAGGIAGAMTTNISMGGETTIHTESISIEPGTNQQTTVRATNVQMIHFVSIRDPAPPAGRDIGEVLYFIDYDSATITPQPGFVMESYPPYWTWDLLQNQVKITLPVRIPRNTLPDTYHCTVRGWQSTDSDNKPADSDDIVITVRNGDT